MSGPRRPTGGGAVTFGDILGAAGFADRERLVAAARAWDDCLGGCRPNGPPRPPAELAGDGDHQTGV
jgi:hypothetical protein